METLAYLIRPSEVECAARDDMVDMPSPAVILPSHYSSELALQILKEGLE
jgi:hypothetical protein